MQKIKVYLDELETSGNELVSYSKNDIANKISELKSATSNLVWEGNGADNYIENYNSKINKLEEYNNSLTTIANYLLTAKDSYTETNEKINNSYEELLAEYNIVEDDLDVM